MVFPCESGNRSCRAGANPARVRDGSQLALLGAYHAGVRTSIGQLINNGNGGDLSADHRNVIAVEISMAMYYHKNRHSIREDLVDQPVGIDEDFANGILAQLRNNPTDFRHPRNKGRAFDDLPKKETCHSPRKDGAAGRLMRNLPSRLRTEPFDPGLLKSLPRISALLVAASNALLCGACLGRSTNSSSYWSALLSNAAGTPASPLPRPHDYCTALSSPLPSYTY